MTWIDAYKTHLEDEDRSALTVAGYLADARLFLAWFEQRNREDFALEAVTPSDVREYRQYLQTEQGFKASTVNRKLASLSALMDWAVQSGRIQSDPTAKMKYVKKAAQSPKWLDKQEQYALQRAVEKDLQARSSSWDWTMSRSANARGRCWCGAARATRNAWCR